MCKGTYKKQIPKKTNPKSQNGMPYFVICDLKLGIYLEFGTCNLEFIWILITIFNHQTF